MNYVRGANHTQQLGSGWLTENTKWKCAIIKVFGGRLGYESKVEFRKSVRSSQFCEPPGEREDDGLHSPDARHKVVRIEKKLHAKLPAKQPTL